MRKFLQTFLNIVLTVVLMGMFRYYRAKYLTDSNSSDFIAMVLSISTACLCYCSVLATIVETLAPPSKSNSPEKENNNVNKDS